MQENILLHFMFLKKNNKKANKTNLFKILEDCQKQNLEGKIFELK